MLTVHLRIVDDASGRATPVRLRVTGPGGAAYFPFGSHHEFPLCRNEDVGGRVRVGSEAWVYIDGGCEIRLPAGVPLRVQATKGPEYEPLDETVALGPGQLTARFAVKRWSDVRADGWFPGDTRVHFIPPHAAALEAAAEDVSVVNLLACETTVPGQDGHLYSSAPHLTAFSGQQPALEAHSAAVAVNTLNVHPVLGKVGLLHSHRVVYPLAFGEPDYPDDWSVCDWCDQCHRKNGLTVWVDPFPRTRTAPPGGEALIAAILGKIDAIEFDSHTPPEVVEAYYHLLLSAGIAVPLVGGSGKDSNRVPLGGMRTYARPPANEPLTYTNWVNAVRAGHSYATNGPLLTFDVGGRGPGEIVELGGVCRLVRVRAAAVSPTPFDKLTVIANREVIAEADATFSAGRWSAGIECDHPAIESAWMAARVHGQPPDGANPASGAFAHTSPAYLKVGDRPIPRREAALKAVRSQVEKTRDWVERQGRFTDGKWKRHLLGLCDAALGKLADRGAGA